VPGGFSLVEAKLDSDMAVEGWVIPQYSPDGAQGNQCQASLQGLFAEIR
jgi:hypothetical protein